MNIVLHRQYEVAVSGPSLHWNGEGGTLFDTGSVMNIVVSPVVRCSSSQGRLQVPALAGVPMICYMFVFIVHLYCYIFMLVKSKCNEN